MLRVIKAALRGLAMFAGALPEDGAGAFSWLLRTAYEGWSGRSFAREAAEEAEAEAREIAARDAQDQMAVRHEEHALLAERQIGETRALREEMVRLARRRDEIRAQSRSHDAEIRSSRWLDDEPEPESGAPMPALA